MEKLSLLLDPLFDGKDFDEALKNTLPEAGDLKVIVKHDATQGGNSVVMITFTVELPDGTRKRVKAVTTALLFVQSALAIQGSVARFNAMRGMS